MKNLYFFDDKGISTLVKALVTNFISSKYYTSILDKISELVTRVDNITSTNSSNDIAIIQANIIHQSQQTNPDGSRTCIFNMSIEYPKGFDESNTILLSFTINAWDYNNSRGFNVTIYPDYIKFDNYGRIDGQLTLPYKVTQWYRSVATICITRSK